METAQKLYELSYFISPDIPEERLVAEVNKIKELAGASGVMREQMPQRRRLAYPINHKEQGFFGFFHFSAAAERVKSIHETLALDKDIIRHLIVSVTKQQVAQMQKPVRNLMAEEKVRKATDKAAVDKAIFKKEDAISSTEEQKVELGELDKKLEEILNK
ncbi:MAG: 30S ribosomal protein S6 [Patescibacteria group bacterium]